MTASKAGVRWVNGRGCPWRVYSPSSSQSPKPEAKYIVFRCADGFKGAADEDDSPYYESIDMDDVYHPQTLLAYQLNGKPLPVANGAPLRLRVERQLGYEHAKYLTKIEWVTSFADIEGGRGGYREERGYQGYAGI